MTLIKPDSKRGTIHKQSHAFPAEREDCFKLTGVSKQTNPMIYCTNMFVSIVEKGEKSIGVVKRGHIVV